MRHLDDVGADLGQQRRDGGELVGAVDNVDRDLRQPAFAREFARQHRGDQPRIAVAAGQDEADLAASSDIAQAISAGHVDCGIATRSVAKAAGLDFQPLTWERFDLVMRQRDCLMKVRRRCSILCDSKAAELDGYDVSEAGAVRPVNWRRTFSARI